MSDLKDGAEISIQELLGDNAKEVKVETVGDKQNKKSKGLLVLFMGAAFAAGIAVSSVSSTGIEKAVQSVASYANEAQLLINSKLMVNDHIQSQSTLKQSASLSSAQGHEVATSKKEGLSINYGALQQKQASFAHSDGQGYQKASYSYSSKAQKSQIFDQHQKELLTEMDNSMQQVNANIAELKKIGTPEAKEAIAKIGKQQVKVAKALDSFDAGLAPEKVANKDLDNFFQKASHEISALRDYSSEMLAEVKNGGSGFDHGEDYSLIMGR
jgi:hypothetical protein